MYIGLFLNYFLFPFNYVKGQYFIVSIMYSESLHFLSINTTSIFLKWDSLWLTEKHANIVTTIYKKNNILFSIHSLTDVAHAICWNWFWEFEDFSSLLFSVYSQCIQQKSIQNYTVYLNCIVYRQVYYYFFLNFWKKIHFE